MSAFYAAGQFDHAFAPTKLRNWELGTNPFPGKFAICNPIPCEKVCPIAYDNGHLYECIPRNTCTSPWGDYATWTWEDVVPCCCWKKERLPHLFKPEKAIYITRESNCPDQDACAIAEEFNCKDTKEGMVEDIACGRDPCCPGQCCPGPYAKPMIQCFKGDRKMIKKIIKDMRRNERISNVGRGGGGCTPESLNLRFALGCSAEAASIGCAKRKWRP